VRREEVVVDEDTTADASFRDEREGGSAQRG
jgi:hypothetical protein